MNLFIKGTKEISFNRENSKISFNKVRNSLLSESQLKEYYNGKISICKKYTFKGGRVTVDVAFADFFDILNRNFIGEKSNLIMSTNGIVEIKDEVLLLNRGEDVYAYKNYWDFPAGLVPFGEDPRLRLINRVQKETSVELNKIKVKNVPSLIEVQEEPLGKYFALYYPVKINLSKKKLIHLLKNSGIEFMLIKKTKILDLLKKNSLVYPKNVLLKIYLESLFKKD